MSGKKGCSGGWRPGAGRKPGATQIVNKRNAINKSNKNIGKGPTDVQKQMAQKLTAFFSKKPAAATAENNVQPLPSLECPQPHAHSASTFQSLHLKPVKNPSLSICCAQDV